jgi:NAD(P)H-hydrate epimerase
LVPEAMTETLGGPDDLDRLVEGKACVAVGPGLGRGDLARGVVEHLLNSASLPLVLDADALNLVAERGLGAMLTATAGRTQLVLTPHPGEFARLAKVSVADVVADPVSHGRRLASATGAVVVLKMATTMIAHPDGRVALNSTGNSGMGTGGSGDVLTGLIASLVAQGAPAWDAARLGVYVHGLAGDLAAAEVGKRGLVAGDLVLWLGDAFEVLCRRG